MLKRKRTYVILVLLILAGIGAYFEPTHHVRGWVHREAFFKDRPTSYWSSVVAYDLGHLNFFLSPQYAGPPSFWERCKNWLGSQARSDSSFDLLCADGEPVLHDLTKDASPKVAGFCADALNYPAKADAHDLNSYWQDLVIKHQRIDIPPIGPKYTR